MALLGLLSLAQIWFVPGYLLLCRTKDISSPDKLLLAFPLSAAINFFLVYVLVLLNAYTQQVVLLVFGLEVFALTFMARTGFKEPSEAQRASSKLIGFKFDFTNVVFVIFVLVYASQFFNQLGSVFTQGDAVSSWNFWAVSWFNGVIPHGLAWYPQLLPTLYSLTYQFIADSRVELFAKIAVSFYPLVALGMFARIASLLPSERKKILWSAIIFFLLVRRLWGGESTINGYADFPLAFFCLAVIYVFALKFTEPNRNVSPASFTLAVVMVGVATGAGLMKQSGMFLGMFIPFIWLAYFRNGRDFSAHVKQSAAMGIAIAVACATWYLYQYWRIATGIEQSNLKMLSSIVQMTWYESIAFGFKSITYKLSWLWVILFLAALMHRKIRYVAIGLVAPFFLLWAAFVPYDYRNLAVIFPLIGLTLAYGWGELARVAGSAFSPRISYFIGRGLMLSGIAIFAFALSNPKINDELLKLSNSAKSQIGDPEINNRLLAYFEFHPEPALVATPYQEMRHIPEIGQRFSQFSCGADYGKQSSTMDVIMSELTNPSIRYVLLQPWCDTRALEYFASQPDKYHALFTRNGAVFYSIISRQ